MELIERAPCCDFTDPRGLTCYRGDADSFLLAFLIFQRFSFIFYALFRLPCDHLESWVYLYRLLWVLLSLECNRWDVLLIVFLYRLTFIIVRNFAVLYFYRNFIWRVTFARLW